jgi:hypothetical protein
MRRTALRGIAAITAVVAALTWAPSPSAAQTPDGAAALSVSPPTSSIDVAAGQTYKKKISLDNISDFTRSVTVETHNFAANGEDGEARLTQEQGSYSLREWIKVSPPTATLKPHGHQDFEVTITVPNNAPPGGHFGALVFSPAAGGGAEGASLSVVSQVSSLILLRVPGDAHEEASIQSLTACTTEETEKTRCEKSKKLFTGKDLSFTTRVQNAGNVQVMPQGTVTVRNMFGKKVAELPVNGANVLPESIRRFETKWTAKNPFGQYKVTVDLKYGTEEQVLSKTTTFWILPMNSIFLGLGLIFVIFFLGWLPRKRWKKAFKALAAGD